MLLLFKVNALLTSALDRNTPRTCTPENANTTTSGDNSDLYVADLAINPVTKEIDWSNSKPIVHEKPSSQVQENMKQLLDMIIGFFEVEAQKVESGTLKEEEMLLTPYVQEFNTDTKHPTRSLPPGFIRRRA